MTRFDADVTNKITAALLQEGLCRLRQIPVSEKDGRKGIMDQF